ncbi:hypothetical protein [Streptomyces sp. Agncl-13]|uniref:hypothetical protein n=1 Tax=Streptomyces sp. Agncl-13 TaxID=3400628 RepID=UPI003A8A9102
MHAPQVVGVVGSRHPQIDPVDVPQRLIGTPRPQRHPGRERDRHTGGNSEVGHDVGLVGHARDPGSPRGRRLRGGRDEHDPRRRDCAAEVGGRGGCADTAKVRGKVVVE